MKEVIDAMNSALVPTDRSGRGNPRPFPNQVYVPAPRPPLMKYDDYTYGERSRPYEFRGGQYYPYVDDSNPPPRPRDQHTHIYRASRFDMKCPSYPPPIHSELQEENHAKKRITDVKFTLSHKKMTSHEIENDTSKRLNKIPEFLDDATRRERKESATSELQSKIEKLKKMCETAELSKDTIRASDLKYYAIPNLK